MTTTQRYISRELTHFIGSKSRKSKNRCKEDRQYELLIKILGEGWLYNPRVGVGLVVKLGAKISQNEMYLPQMVCFSDIPVEDLTLHKNKYSGFGISFNKDFIVRQGGVPIHYIPSESYLKMLLNITPEQSAELLEPDGEEHLAQVIKQGGYFDEIVKRYHKLFPVLHKIIVEAALCRSILGDNAPVNSIWDLPKDGEDYPIIDLPYDVARRSKPNINNNPGRDAIWYGMQLSQLQRFLEFHIFSYLKFFNHSYPDSHKKNYYFEREWRVLGRVQFNTADVRRVLIPEGYSRQFRDDCPDYCGQVTFTEI